MENYIDDTGKITASLTKFRSVNAVPSVIFIPPKECLDEVLSISSLMDPFEHPYTLGCYNDNESIIGRRTETWTPEENFERCEGNNFCQKSLIEEWCKCYDYKNYLASNTSMKGLMNNRAKCFEMAVKQFRQGGQDLTKTLLITLPSESPYRGYRRFHTRYQKNIPAIKSVHGNLRDAGNTLGYKIILQI